MKVESKKEIIKASDRDVFEFLSDFTNFTVLMPDKIENWKATKDSCSFTAKGYGDFGMKISKRDEYGLIEIINDENMSLPLKFVFRWDIRSVNSSSVEVLAAFDVDINPMMSVMVKKPLKKLSDVLVEKLKERMEMN